MKIGREKFRAALYGHVPGVGLKGRGISMILDRYYYYRLNDTEKAIYARLFKGVQSHAPEIRLDGEKLEANAVEKAYRAITLDNPLLYYLGKLEYAIDDSGVTMKPCYDCRPETVAENNKNIQKSVKQIFSRLDMNHLDEYEKEKRIHDYLVTHTDYDYEALDTDKRERVLAAHSIIGIFSRQQAVCEGTAKACKLLLNVANIKCLVVTGKATHPRDGMADADSSHAWNIVRIGNRSYHLDVTWDAIRSSDSYICYDYLNVPERAIRIDHTGFSGMPDCTGWEANFHVRSGLMFSDTQNLKDYLRRELFRGARSFHFRMLRPDKPMADIVEDAARYLMERQTLYGSRYTARYVFSNDQNTAHILLG